jgi:hypothetical protein
MWTARRPGDSRAPPATIPALASYGGECGERFDRVKDARPRRAPAKPVLRILDTIEAVSPKMLAMGCKGLCDANAREARVMSYCRFSSDDFCCDLYVYESRDDGFVVHVASNRLVGDPPHVDFEAAPEDLVAQSKAQHRFVLSAERVAIDLPFAGASFREPDLASLRARLEELRGLGYRFPDDVLAEIDREIAAASHDRATEDCRDA